MMTQLFPGGINDFKEASWELKFFLKGKKVWSTEELERTFRKILDGIDLQINPLVEWEKDSRPCLIFRVRVNKTFTFDHVILKGSWKGKQFATLEENFVTLTVRKEDSVSIQVNLE